MLKPVGSTPRGVQGFSLVELLVVLLIFGILIAIAVPSLVSSLPERRLAAAGDLFANDINYCRAKAKSTGNQVYLAFAYEPDVNQVDVGLGVNGDQMDPAASSPPTSGSYINPANPGVRRSCNEYYIVEARPRFVDVDSAGHKAYEIGFNKSRVDHSEAFTYLDWLKQYDRWDGGSGAYPVEPLYPYRRTQTAMAGVFPDPKLGPFNDIAVPLSAYPQLMINGTGDYRSRFRYASTLSAASPIAGNWGAGDPADQQFKVFCVADQREILSYDASYDGSTRVYDKNIDHPRLQDQVVDYVLLKRVTLPKDTFFLNPWRSQYVVGYEDVSGNRLYNCKTMQFLQYLWTFKPNGELAICDWTYDPEPFPDNSYGNLNHGNVREVDNLPSIHTMWMVTAECLDFSAGETYAASYNIGSSVGLVNNKKTNLASSGRMLTLWPINGKYYIDDYTPNDRARMMGKNDARLNQAAVAYTGSATADNVLAYEQGSTASRGLTANDASLSVGAREYGYIQNFLSAPYFSPRVALGMKKDEWVK